MSTLSMDAGTMAHLWGLDPEHNAERPIKLAGQTVTNIKTEGDRVYFDLDDITVISDPSDIYAFEKPDNFVLREDLES